MLKFIYFFFSPIGLSPDLQSMEQIRRIMRPTDVPDTGKKKEIHFILKLLSENFIQSKNKCIYIFKTN